MPDNVTILLIFLALTFDYLNGFHDAANSIATVVGTRVLTPRMAVLWAAFFNFIAFLIFGTHVAGTIGKGIIDPAIVDKSVIAATLIAASLWDLITWYYGIPTSSSHALIGGMLGAALAKVGGIGVVWAGIGKTLLFMLLAPLIGMFVGVLICIIVYWSVHRSSPRHVDKWFRRGQLVSAAAYSLGHGGNDAQKTMGIIFVLLIAGGYLLPTPMRGVEVREQTTGAEVRLVVASVAPGSAAAEAGLAEGDEIAAIEVEDSKTGVRTMDKFESNVEVVDPNTGVRTKKTVRSIKKAWEAFHKVKEGQELVMTVSRAGTPVPIRGKRSSDIPLWIVLSCHAAMGLGTLGGGWRIVATMGQKLTPLKPVDGFCAELAGAMTLFGTGQLGIPVSTTQTITGSIVGVGAIKRFSAVRWGVAARVIWAWVLTIPVSAVISILAYVLIRSIAG